ncbi:uncharacterized protein [Palaemon carinicauda]|uniref:uncharacterized protein isoform X2 n=1 Tax=Palaemon carinicauda TaxID=392227 RepID=UPI0035B60A58
MLQSVRTWRFWGKLYPYRLLLNYHPKNVGKLKDTAVYSTHVYQESNSSITGKMRHSCWLVCLSVLAMVATTFSAHVQSVAESDVVEIPERLRELLLVRRLISSLNAAEALPEVQAQPAQAIRKRTCYINAGLSHGCDYKDLVGAMAEKNYWDSPQLPWQEEEGRQRHLSLF